MIEAYGFAGVRLIETNLDSLPRVDLETLKTQFPHVATHLSQPNFRERLGIAGDGPWPVVLAGYVLGALNRSETEIRASRYQPMGGDEYFPSRR